MAAAHDLEIGLTPDDPDSTHPAATAMAPRGDQSAADGLEGLQEMLVLPALELLPSRFNGDRVSGGLVLHGLR